MASRKIPRKRRSARRATTARSDRAEVYTILGKLSDAISLVATATNALQGAEQRSGRTSAEEINGMRR